MNRVLENKYEKRACLLFAFKTTTIVERRNLKNFFCGVWVFIFTAGTCFFH